MLVETVDCVLMARLCNVLQYASAACKVLPPIGQLPSYRRLDLWSCGRILTHQAGFAMMPREGRGLTTIKWLPGRKH